LLAAPEAEGAAEPEPEADDAAVVLPEPELLEEAGATMPPVALQKGKHDEVVITMPWDVVILLLLLPIALSMLVATAVAFS
jgi:hypothetical protein